MDTNRHNSRAGPGAMVSVANDETMLSRLLEPPPRWGYEHVAPVPPAQSPERENPPQPERVRMIPRPRVTGLWDAAVIATVGAVGILILDSALGGFSIGDIGGGPRAFVVVLADLLAAIVAFWVVRVWQRPPYEDGLGERKQSNLTPALVAVVCFYVPYLVLSIEAFVAWRHIWQRRDDLVRSPREAKRAEAEYEHAVAAWQERIAQFESNEFRRFEATDPWHPVPLSQTARMTCVFGGTAQSWRAALATLGASLLGSATRITICDLSRRLTADTLCELCRDAGFPVSEAVVPGTPAAADNPDLNKLSDMITEALPSAPKGEDTQAGLAVVGIDKQSEDSERDRFADLLFQLLLRWVRQGLAQTDVLVILGADLIGRDKLESLMDHAEQRRMRVLLFFAHFRQDATEVAGAAGAAAAFFALGNHLEAEEASKFIGAEHKWVEEQQTISVGQTLTRTDGSNEAVSTSAMVGLPFTVSVGLSTTRGHSHSEGVGQSLTYAQGRRFVREAVIEPEMLRALPAAEMIYVEVLPGGRRVAANVNCDPRISLSHRLAGEPGTQARVA
jgi:hypothetical protein